MSALVRGSSVRWSEVTALFGGTFDPPHLGHRLAVDGLFADPGVRAVRVLPTPMPAYKPTQAPLAARIEMARLCFAGSAAYPLRGPVTIDLCEIDRAASQPGRATYTYDTLSELGREIRELAFVIGTDQLEKLPSWHRFPDVLGLSHWIVLERKGEPHAAGRQTLAQFEGSGLIKRTGAETYQVRSSGGQGGTFIQVFDTPAPPLSSTAIRESLARTGNPPENSILPEVRAHLMKHRLYGTSSAIQ